MLEFHVEGFRNFNSTWNIITVGLIEGLVNVQITDGVPVFVLKTGSEGLQDPVRAFLTLAL